MTKAAAQPRDRHLDGAPRSGGSSWQSLTRGPGQSRPTSSTGRSCCSAGSTGCPPGEQAAAAAGEPGRPGAPGARRHRPRRGDGPARRLRPSLIRSVRKMVAGEPGPASLAVRGAGPHGRDGLTGDEPVFAGELVGDRERRGDAFRVSMTIVTAGTWRPSCSSRSPSGGWSPWKPQMPRWVVAPLSPAERSRRTMARWIGSPWRWADSEVYTMSLCPSARPASSAPGPAWGASSRPSRLQMRTRSRVSGGRGSSGPSSGSTQPIRSAEPTAMTIIGTSAFRMKNAARSRRPCAVPSTPSSAVAPSMPRRCSRSQTATKAGTRPARSWRPR